MALGCAFWGLLWSTLVLSSSGKDSEFLIWQTPGPVYAWTGAVLTLECKVIGMQPSPPGVVRWYKGGGDSRKPVFPAYKSRNRVTWMDEGSYTDFTILIQNVTQDDSGIYYCVKHKKTHAGEEDFKSGRGTEVMVDKVDYRIPVAAGTACIVLVLLVSGAAAYVFIKKRRGGLKNHDASRPEFPLPENGTMPSKEINKDLVYADLEHSTSPPRSKPSEPEQNSEYATIHVARCVDG